MTTEQIGHTPGRLAEYAYVGPALFELGLDARHIEYVRRQPHGDILEPREVWLPINHTWVRADGCWISGWADGWHFGFRPHLINRWKLRRAVRRWAINRARTDTEGGV